MSSMKKPAIERKLASVESSLFISSESLVAVLLLIERLLRGFVKEAERCEICRTVYGMAAH